MGKIRASLLARIETNRKTKVTVPKSIHDKKILDTLSVEKEDSSTIKSRQQVDDLLSNASKGIRRNLSLGKITKAKDKLVASALAVGLKNIDSNKKHVRFTTTQLTTLAPEDPVTKNLLQVGLGREDGGRSTALDSPTGSRRTILKAIKTTVKDKKIRHKLKREAFRKKIELIKNAEKQKKEAAQRKKTVIVGDMQPLLQALINDDDENASEDSDEKDPDPTDINSSCKRKPKRKKNVKNQLNKINKTEGNSIEKRKKIKMKKRQLEIAQGLEYFAAGLGVGNKME